MSAATVGDVPARSAEAPTVEEASAPARFFFLRPVFAILLTLLLVAVGLGAYMMLVKESLPDLEIPQATVTAFWAGADPETMEQEVTEPIEREISGVRGLKSFSSASYDSSTVITVEFDANADLDQSMQRLRAAVDDARGDLPREVESPNVEQVAVDDRPILSVVLYGDVDGAILAEAAEDLEDRLENVAGVNEVGLGGKREEVVRVRLIPSRLVALGLSPVAVRDAIQAANLDMPWGQIEGAQSGARLRLYGRFRDVEDLRTLPVARLDGGGGRTVLLGEVAEVYRGLARETSRAFFSRDGAPFRPSIEVSITKVPGADTVEVVRRARAALAEAAESRDWPHGLAYEITADQSEQIWDSLINVLNNGWQAVLCVFAVLLVMLSWREGLIAGLAIPLTFLGALGAIWALGYTLNELVIIGMVLALGLVVDVFILMMEGLHEGIFVQRLSFDRAALQTVRRYALPAAAGTATTILALLPLMAIGGLAGKFIRVMPVTTIACLVVAFVVALLIAVPLSRFVIGRVAREDAPIGRVDRIATALSDGLRGWSLRTTLHRRRTALLWSIGAFALFALAIAAFTQVPTILYPKSDGRNLGVTVELPSDTPLDTSERVAERVGAVLRDKPYLESVVELVGKTSPMTQTSIADALTPSTGDYLLGFSARFVPREAREAPAYAYVDALRDEIEAAVDRMHGGASVLLVPETGQPSNEDPIQVEITGTDVDRLRTISQALQAALRAIPGATDVRDNLGPVQTEIRFVPRREALDFYGISQQDLASQVRIAMSEDEIGTFPISGPDEDLEIRLGTAWPSRGGEPGGPTRIDELATIKVFDREGNTVPGLAVLETRTGSAPVAITHKGGERAVQVSAKTSGRPAGEIVAELTPVLERMSADWPTGYAFSLGGEVEEAAETFASAGLMLVVAVLLVFALLVLLFGSFVQPAIILLTIPLGLIGTFGGFFLAGIPFSFFAMVGVIALVGIVVNNAIVMIDTMNDYLARGSSVAEAAAHGAADRLRPIVSTSLTTVLGLIPLAIGNPMWRPLCYAIIFGLIAATVMSLVIVPCLYLLLTRAKQHRALDGADA